MSNVRRSVKRLFVLESISRVRTHECSRENFRPSRVFRPFSHFHPDRNSLERERVDRVVGERGNTRAHGCILVNRNNTRALKVNRCTVAPG